jgi:pimeloyl-ACP methyl ester carboxylesterase
MDAKLADWRDSGEVFDYLGFDVFHRVAGSGPHLLLIHGYPFGSWDWHRIWEALTARFTVVAPDMLGLGFSAKPSAYRYTVARHADMHEALLGHLGIGACHVLAHDLGDSVAQELLARHEGQERRIGLRSLALLNGGLFRGLPAAARAAPALDHAARRAGRASSRAAALRPRAGPDAGRAVRPRHPAR